MAPAQSQPSTANRTRVGASAGTVSIVTLVTPDPSLRSPAKVGNLQLLATFQRRLVGDNSGCRVRNGLVHVHRRPALRQHRINELMGQERMRAVVSTSLMPQRLREHFGLIPSA